jgi:hypothetical protein
MKLKLELGLNYHTVVIFLSYIWPAMATILLLVRGHDTIAMSHSCPKATRPQRIGVSWVAYIPAARASMQFVADTWAHIMGPMMRGGHVVWVTLPQSRVPQRHYDPPESISLHYIATKHNHLQHHYYHQIIIEVLGLCKQKNKLLPVLN